jgi:hypothetical protein
MHEIMTGPLTEENKRQFCSMLSAGCDRETVAKFVGCSLADFLRQMACDPPFAIEVRRSEAASEIVHLKNVQKAAKDERHWRASVWWLERRAPNRYAPRHTRRVTPRQLESLINVLGAVLVEEVHHEGDRRRLAARLEQAVGSLDSWIHDDMSLCPTPDTIESQAAEDTRTQRTDPRCDRTTPDDPTRSEEG